MDDMNTSNTSYSSDAGTKKSKKTVLWVVIAILALALGGGGGFAWGQMNKQHDINQAKETARKEEAKKHTTDQAGKASDMQQTAPAKVITEPTCNADELSLEAAEGNDSGAGTLAYNLVLTNVGKRTCTLNGFPGVSLVNDNGNMVGQPATRATNYTEKQLSLAPGVKVKAIVSMEDSSNFEAGQCKNGATKFRIYPPNDTGYLSAVAPTDNWCPEMAVSPVLAM